MNFREGQDLRAPASGRRLWRRAAALLAGAIMTAALAVPAAAEWTHRYPLVEGFSHHVYLEGYQFPIFSAGPIDPAPAPEGERLAFSAGGWIWILDLESGAATRLTDGAALDNRPRWSPDGEMLTFLRDNGLDTSVVFLNLDTGESQVINTEKIELDPTFSPDGRWIYYSSAAAGGLDIWRYNLASGESERVTDLAGVERNPRFIDGGKAMVYLWGAGFSGTHLRVRDLLDGTDRIIESTSIAGQAMADGHPKERTIVFAWPMEDRWRILVADVDDPVPTDQLVAGATGRPQMPAYSADGKQVYYVDVDGKQQFHLMRISALGGKAQEVAISSWDWGQPRATLTIETHAEGDDTPLPARLSVVDDLGHPVATTQGPNYFDPMNGIHYFYSEGEITLNVPAGEVTITAVHGPMGVVTRRTVNLSAGAEASVGLGLTDAWNPHQAGYAAGTHHFHLNYDGTYAMTPADLVPLMDGEDLSVTTPLAANLHNRLPDLRFEGVRLTSDSGRLIVFGQEVRSHFHGHIGLVGAADFYYPPFWGPGYPNYGQTDLSNKSVLDFIADRGGIGTYVHPIISSVDPFKEENLGGIPLESVSDAVLGDMDGLEIVCAWSDELGTAALWYRFLNIGRPVLAMAGTDMFADFHRTPALGASRTYVQMAGEALNFDNYLARLKGGHNFVTNGPALLFRVGDEGPGGVVDAGGQDWTLQLSSSIAVEKVEILVNGQVVWTGDGVGAGETRRYSGTLTLPAGGWVAARATGGAVSWPVMDSYPFAHSAPVWIGAVGSTDPAAMAAAKADLLRALDNAEARARAAYGDADITTLLGRFAAARAWLKE